MINTTKDYSIDRIVTKHKNYQFLNKESSISDKRIEYSFVIKPMASRLLLQASTFSSNFVNHGDYNLQKILRCRHDQVEDILTKMYVYSYIKNFHNGLFCDKLNDSCDLGYSFEGHQQLFEVIKSPYQRRVREDIFIDSKIKLGNDTTKQVSIALLISQFPFLKEYSSYIDNLGFEAFLIPKYESYFSFLTEDFYAARSTGDIANTAILKGPKVDTRGDKGKISVVGTNNETSRQILKEGSYPITNAFTNVDDSKLYFIEVNGSHSINDNPSFFFSKANFIKISSNANTTKFVNKFYLTKELTPKEDFLTCSEVFTITGIRCKYIGEKKEKLFSNIMSTQIIDSIIYKLGQIPEKFDDITAIIKAINTLAIEFDNSGNQNSGK